MKYEKPEINVYLYSEEDVIRTSGDLTDDMGGYKENDWDSFVS